MKGCAWLATDDSRREGQTDSRTDGLKPKCCQVQGTFRGVRGVLLLAKDESLFTACALHLTEMNCSPATSCSCCSSSDSNLAMTTAC
ncbi:hypothetical protein ACLKA6_010272 [Drosophila palustris]